MASLWKLEYFDDPNWVPIVGKFSQSLEELKGHEEADIILPNTSANRTFVDSDQTVKISFDDNEVFTGALMDYDMTATQLKCVLYNAVFEAMKGKTITADYSGGAPANTIFAAICTAAGVTAGSCPTTTVGVKFIDAQCYMAAVFLSDICNSDYSASNGTFNIAARGTLRTATHYKIQSRGVSRAQVRNKVRVRGVDINGTPIVGEAGTGDKVTVKIENKVSDVASLNLLAAKYLADLNTDSKGAPLIFPINEAYGFKPGDTFAVTNARYRLNGTYPMKRVTKTSTKVTAELDVAKETLEQLILDYDKYAEYGIYYVSPGSIPVTLNYQGLELFQYLNEGKDVFITDYGLKCHQGIGNGITWTTSTIGNGLACTFEAAGYIVCGCDWPFAGTSQFSLSVWLTPETILNDTDCYFMLLPNNFQMYQHLGNLKVGIYTGAGSTYHELTILSAFQAGVRKHLVVTYDGANLKIYLDNVLAASTPVTGNFSAFDPMWELCVGSDYGGEGYVGQMDTLLIFSRTITEREISDLYHYSNLITPPAPPATNALDTFYLKYHFHLNEGTGTQIIEVADSTIIGTLHDCTWEANTSAPKLRFADESGSYAIIPNLTIGGTDKLAVGCWVTPSLVYPYMIPLCKADEVKLDLSAGCAGFAVKIGSVWKGASTSALLIVPDKTYFIMGIYDGTYIRMYVNGTERHRELANGNVDSAVNDTYLGVDDLSEMSWFYGIISELMIWRG